MKVQFNTMEMKEIYDRGVINVGNLARMNQVMKKARSGKAIKIGFIGGSITAGAAASTDQNCYASLVSDWWRNKFPQSEVTYMNAGVGATNSKFGVARVEEDLLSGHPDVVFAEFSVNDEDTDVFQETFEGLIRKILLHPTEPALFMFNNVFYDDGRSAQRVHNEVGKFYELPIVSIKDSIYAEIQKNTIDRIEITADNLHPNDTGHKLLAGVITNLLDMIYAVVIQNLVEKAVYEVPMETVTKNRYYNSVRHNAKSSEPMLKGFVKDTKIKQNQWDVFRYGWTASEEGSSITFEVEASRIAIQYCKYAIHPAPIAKVVIDKEESKAVVLDANFNETWGNCLYLQDITDTEDYKKHSVMITITKAVEGVEFYLASVITV